MMHNSDKQKTERILESGPGSRVKSRPEHRPGQRKELIKQHNPEHKPAQGRASRRVAAHSVRFSSIKVNAIQWFRLALLVPALGFSGALLATTIDVVDDTGQQLHLPGYARRVVSVAPHATEMLFAAGATSQVVGVSAYSDFPAAATRLPQVGDVRQLDMERILSLKPDLLVVWASGTPARQQEQLKKLGIPIFYSEPRKLGDIADSIDRLAQAMGTTREAAPVVSRYQASLAQLRQTYQQRRVVRVFYQISDKPLYTLNGQHIVSDGFALCGAQNVFAGLPVIAPAVSTEAVLQQDPEVIIGSETNIAMWKQFPGMLAVRRSNLRTIDGNLLARSGPRMIDGIQRLCEVLDQARRLPPP